ncbi:unnamed protein product [Adineta steineri]|uniref:P/Homo B domain-containing protein n=1 Tax=Adineta steineri TaxID=433720 RepID=A0A819KNE5_9BILA|nr:unnamed protein product [Adineta steineri]CAF3948237.1 unnamed protein product [Adineta steineri]
MFPSIILTFILCFTLFSTTISSKSIVIEVKGDCETVGGRIAHEHGYRYVRQIFDGFCEIEEDPLSVNHRRHRRAIQQGFNPADIISKDEDVEWAEYQIPKTRRKREFLFNDPQWNSMWYLIRHSQTPHLPDLNVTGAWEMGYTGRGQVVTFLDDGLEYDHPDLQENYDKDASTDINGNDDDPTPRYEVTNENKHGTRCAGEVAAKVNNNICGVGIAYHARVGGIRMLDGDVTDSVEARSLSHRPDHIGIYSASWGPDDNGLVVDGPGRLAKKAFENGALHGRDGKGSIFVWASGNGGRQSDSCACDGYITSIYTIAISATTEHGDKPWYLEECSATLASAYSSGQSSNGERDIYTTDLNHACTAHHTGTSAAAPLAAAIYALVLEANPDLTWRDIMHITVLGSRPDAIPSNNNIVRNAAGLSVSNRFGFGLMDAGLMTWYASGWKNVPSMSTCESVTDNPKRVIPSRSNEIFSLNLMECKDDIDPTHEVNYIEQVQIFVTLLTDRRGEIELFLYSPSNTRTQILPKRERDMSNKGFQDWPFLTVQLWGEVPHGQWKLQVVNTGGGSATLISWKLLVHGTREYPISPRSETKQLTFGSDRPSCHIECNPDKPCGNTDTNCTSCRHLKQPLSDGKFRCVGICPEGTYTNEEDKLCLPCHSQCGSCRNASEYSCISCKTDFSLIHDTMTCVESCPEQYYTDHHLRKCIHCKNDCASCDTSSQICTSCPDGYALKDIDCIKASKKCQSNEYFSFTENDCRWCDSRCLTCSGSRSDQCKSCDKTSKYPYLQYRTCVSSCSTGFYFSKNLFQCLPCHETCLNCTSSSESSCTSCKLGYVFLSDNHRCEKHTGKPYYLDVNTGETHTCHGSCTQCKGPKPNDCIACNSMNEVLLDDGHCVNQCPLGFYKSQKQTMDYQTNVCLPCSIGCKKCNNISQCYQCDESKGYKLINSVCVLNCKPRTFLSGDRCESCQNPCITCMNLTSCLTCVDQFLLLNDQCVEECPEGYYLYDQQCLQCHPICNTCKGPTEDDCRTCTKGFIFNEKEKKCLGSCPNGNYFDKDQNDCKLCTNNCLECLNPGSYCRQCIFPMSLDTITHRCLHCCTTNLTTNDCCQCPSSWDGFCLHPLVTPSTHIADWFENSIDNIRHKFNELNKSPYTIPIIISIPFLISIIICLITYSLCQMCSSRSTTKQQEHNNVEYVMLQNIDDNDDDEEEEEDKESILTNGHSKQVLSNETLIPMDHVEKT